MGHSIFRLPYHFSSATAPSHGHIDAPYSPLIFLIAWAVRPQELAALGEVPILTVVDDSAAPLASVGAPSFDSTAGAWLATIATPPAASGAGRAGALRIESRGVAAGPCGATEAVLHYGLARFTEDWSDCSGVTCLAGRSLAFIMKRRAFPLSHYLRPTSLLVT